MCRRCPIRASGPARNDLQRSDRGARSKWLSDAGIAERLRDLMQTHGTGRLAGDNGQFSLAGAQPKMPLLNEEGRCGIPSGATLYHPYPQATGAWRTLTSSDDQRVLSCLRLANDGSVSMAADSTVSTPSRTTVLSVVVLYDCQRDADGKKVRVYHEDACQALGVTPLRKYENEGGPGPAEIVALIMRESDRPDHDVGVFVDALALNWVIGGTDAHAKNYSFLISVSSVQLTPLYDLISVLPYPRRVHYREAKLAMRVDREYHLWKVRRRHWEGLAVRCELDPEPLVDVVSLGSRLRYREAARRAAESVRDEGIDHDIVGRAESSICEHAEQCLGVLAKPGLTLEEICHDCTERPVGFALFVARSDWLRLVCPGSGSRRGGRGVDRRTERERWRAEMPPGVTPKRLRGLPPRSQARLLQGGGDEDLLLQAIGCGRVRREKPVRSAASMARRMWQGVGLYPLFCRMASRTSCSKSPRVPFRHPNLRHAYTRWRVCIVRICFGRSWQSPGAGGASWKDSPR